MFGLFKKKLHNKVLNFNPKLPRYYIKNVYSNNALLFTIMH